MCGVFISLVLAQVTSSTLLKGDFVSQIPSLVCDRFARKVFLYLLAPGNKQYFSATGTCGDHTSRSCGVDGIFSLVS